MQSFLDFGDLRVLDVRFSLSPSPYNPKHTQSVPKLYPETILGVEKWGFRLKGAVYKA